VSTLHAARFAILFVLLSGIAAAQTPLPSSEPVWSVDFVKAKPGRHDQAMQFFNQSWVRAREIAKEKGAIVDFHILVEPSANEDDTWQIMLMTEYRNQAAYDAREAAFGPILHKLFPDGPPVINGLTRKELFDVTNSRVLHDLTAGAGPYFKKVD
jgi:hypothetical protein